MTAKAKKTQTAGIKSGDSLSRDIRALTDKIGTLPQAGREELASYLEQQFNTNIRVNEVAGMLMELAHSDITDFIDQDEDGFITLKSNIKKLPEHKRRQIKEISYDKAPVYVKGEGFIGYKSRLKLKLYDKVKILEHVQKYLDMWGDNRAGHSAGDKLTKIAKQMDALVQKASERITQDAEYEEERPD